MSFSLSVQLRRSSRSSRRIETKRIGAHWVSWFRYAYGYSTTDASLLNRRSLTEKVVSVL